MSTYEYMEQKVKIGVKNPLFSIQIPFFLKRSCTLVPRELEHDIWQIIFKLVVFYEIIIGNPQTAAICELKGGGVFDHPVLWRDFGHYEDPTRKEITRNASEPNNIFIRCTLGIIILNLERSRSNHRLLLYDLFRLKGS